MELQQHTNLKSVNIKQLIQCNKNAVYMRYGIGMHTVKITSHVTVTIKWTHSLANKQTLFVTIIIIFSI